MSRSMLLPVLATALCIAPLAAQSTPATPPATPVAAKPFTAEETVRYMALGQKVNRWFFEGYADSIVAIAAPDVREKMGGVEGVTDQMDRFNQRAGAMVRVVEEKMTRRNGVPQFWFEAEFMEYTDGTLVLRWLFNEEGQLVGAGMGPRNASMADGG